ncbi:unnamed protein product [Discosporangium mesarthrocarpum]
MRSHTCTPTGRLTTAAVALVASWTGTWTPAVSFLSTPGGTSRRGLEGPTSSGGLCVRLVGNGRRGTGTRSVSGRSNQRPMACTATTLGRERLYNESRSYGGTIRCSSMGLRGQSSTSKLENSLSRVARIVPAEEPWLSEAGASLRRGALVAFPTETVYGLGANAFSEEAVLNVFKAKQRPLTDPLIVHVPDVSSAMAVLDFQSESSGGEEARRLFAHLGKKLWPGPLTLILKAAPVLPGCVTAGTGFVGVRCPAHPVALQLLSLARVPVAAPSANRFGHVSATSAAHVMEDLGDSDITILDGDTAGSCGIGIESTVVKVDATAGRLLILRKGGLSEGEIRSALAEGGAAFARFSVGMGNPRRNELPQNGGPAPGDSQGGVEEAKGQGEAGDEAGLTMQSPGQLLQHYSPDVETYQVLSEFNLTLSPGGVGRGNGVLSGDDAWKIMAGGLNNASEGYSSTTVVVDFGRQLQGLKETALAYTDLSPKGDAQEAAMALFHTLRWAETHSTVERLLVAGLPSVESGDLAAAVNDRIYRAASGKVIRL